MLTGTAQAWVEAITDGRSWDRQRDAGRVRTAFLTLARTIRRWPAPVEFLEALPPVAAPLALVADRRPADPEVARKAVEQITAMLGDVVQPMPKARVERETTPEQRERIEADLQAHYARKKA